MNESDKKDQKTEEIKRQTKLRQQVAVALECNLQSGNLPEVTAIGRGKIADQILNIAFANGIKVREDANLAELLSALDTGSEIPAEALATVAEILVYVYRANGRLDEILDADDLMVSDSDEITDSSTVQCDTAGEKTKK